MTDIYHVYATQVEYGIAVSDSDPIIVALYGAGQDIDENDGADLRIIDEDGDNLISRFEFRDATIGEGIGLNGGAEAILFDGVPGKGHPAGTLYTKEPITEGTDLNDLIKDCLHANFEPTSFNEESGCPIPCYSAGTMIDTINGPQKIEDLKEGDMVATQDHGYQPVMWHGKSMVSDFNAETNVDLRPIRIRAGALGQDLPRDDLIVSPQHRMLLASPIVEKEFGVPEILVPAKKLLGLRGIEVADDLNSAEYHHILFNRHEIIFASGAPSESLLTGPMAMAAMGEDAKAEITALFPDIAAADYNAVSARPLADTGKKIKRVIARHGKHQDRRSLCENWQRAGTKQAIPAAAPLIPVDGYTDMPRGRIGGPAQG